MSTYSVACECGATHPVAAYQAGVMFDCECGRVVKIPSLAALRSSAGESAMPLSTIEKIRLMVLRGELPSGDVCPHSGRRADDTMLFQVQCENSWFRGDDTPNGTTYLIGYLLLGWLGALLLSLRSGTREEFGRNTSVTLPLRISSEARPELLRMRRQRRLKALLRHTPIYAELLKEYPSAKVTVVQPGSHTAPESADYWLS